MGRTNPLTGRRFMIPPTSHLSPTEASVLKRCFPVEDIEIFDAGYRHSLNQYGDNHEYEEFDGSFLGFGPPMRKKRKSSDAATADTDASPEFVPKIARAVSRSSSDSITSARVSPPKSSNETSTQPNHPSTTQLPTASKSHEKGERHGISSSSRISPKRPSGNKSQSPSISFIASQHSSKGQTTIGSSTPSGSSLYPQSSRHRVQDIKHSSPISPSLHTSNVASPPTKRSSNNKSPATYTLPDTPQSKVTDASRSSPTRLGSPSNKSRLAKQAETAGNLPAKDKGDIPEFLRKMMQRTSRPTLSAFAGATRYHGKPRLAHGGNRISKSTTIQPPDWLTKYKDGKVSRIERYRQTHGFPDLLQIWKEAGQLTARMASVNIKNNKRHAKLEDEQRRKSSPFRKAGFGSSK
ncbi:uncharacterized protein SPPG_00375 [Spizellomyces punctatus DAOM BR117]|uniref:Uncharacterized protein n=1 Tax=Spizellomyces punctatus (strain DAOM BR117) TaxID=645134 RepID=A0A0L0HUX1_SPIPD|nr:uncharacterized protein SPPG_00375 [Spizellomyces punctatus DAOM BR117]KND04659.1 hypothetical protein SPPG_00375 [Spizellomyces punctatus DAOM BR117]|eukprot:XP_016612698.1 hypothetical protein SPPG_00375 [Spizellomyces punctatus DAOM BR117]